MDRPLAYLITALPPNFRRNDSAPAPFAPRAMRSPIMDQKQPDMPEQQPADDQESTEQQQQGAMEKAQEEAAEERKNERGYQ